MTLDETAGGHLELVGKFEKSNSGHVTALVPASDKPTVQIYLQNQNDNS